MAGHIERAVGLNARRVHKVNVELVEKPVKGITHITCPMPLPKPPSLPEKLVFSRLQDQIACTRRAR